MRIALLFLVILTAAQSAISPGGMSITQQFAAADVVAVGRCSGFRLRDPKQPVERDGHLVPVDYVAEYSLFSVYKGPANMKVAVFFPERNPEWGPPACLDADVLLFLNQSGDGFTLADASFGVRYFPGEPAHTGHLTAGLSQLETDIAAFLSTGDPAKAATAVNLLGDFDQLSDATISVLERAATKLDPNASALRLVMLARHNPEKYFDDLMRHAADVATADQPMIAVRFCEAVERAANPEHVEALEAVVKGGAVESPVRVCSMSAIRRMKVPGTVPFLIREIDAPDLDVAYLAVIALADITDKNGDFGPGMSLFRKNPDKYRAVWREWWHETGSRQF